MRVPAALALLCALFAPSAAQAAAPDVLDLAQAWSLARQHDPALQAAVSEREAGQTQRAMGRAALLPQVSASASRTLMRGTLDSPDARGNTQRTDLHYTASINEIRATQSLFDWSRISGYRQGHARADHSLAQFDTRANDAVERLVNRYFQVLLTQDDLALSQALLSSTERQVHAAQRRFDSGEGTVVDVHEAQSRRDMADAERIASEDALTLARRELQEMLGQPPRQLRGLTADFTPRPPEPATQDEWLSRAMQQNARIRTAEQQVRVASHEVQRAFGGHLPSVDAVASRRVVDNETLSTRNQASATTSVGVQVTLPIYAGGLTSAQVDQARHQRDHAARQLDAERERVAVEIARHYQGVSSGMRHIEALRTAERSSAAALHAVQRGYEAGTRSLIDVLDAQDQLHRARLELTRARLDYVRSQLMLAVTADTLTPDVMASVSDRYFARQARGQ